MYSPILSGLALILVLLSASPAVADEGVFGLFAEPDDSVSLMLVGNSKGQPSMWQKMGTGTKNFFTGTFDLLTLKGLREKSAKPKQVSGYGQSKKKKPSVWSSMFGPKEPKRPETLTEFLNQDRLDP